MGNFMITVAMGCLGLSILATFCLVVWTFIWIASDMKSMKKKEKVCKWTFREDGIYSTECHNDFYDASESGNPVTDSLTYCAFCGGRIKDQ